MIRIAQHAAQIALCLLGTEDLKSEEREAEKYYDERTQEKRTIEANLEGKTSRKEIKKNKSTK
jgi:hypothetical protein